MEYYTPGAFLEALDYVIWSVVVFLFLGKPEDLSAGHPFHCHYLDRKSVV